MSKADRQCIRRGKWKVLMAKCSALAFTESSERIFDSFGVLRETSVWHFNVVFWAIVWVSHCQWRRLQSFAAQTEVCAWRLLACIPIGRPGVFIPRFLDRSVKVRQNEWGLNWKQSSLPLCAMPFSVIRCCLLSPHCVAACVFSGAIKTNPSFRCPEPRVRPVNPAL